MYGRERGKTGGELQPSDCMVKTDLKSFQCLITYLFDSIFPCTRRGKDIRTLRSPGDTGPGNMSLRSDKATAYMRVLEMNVGHLVPWITDTMPFLTWVDK